MEPSCTGAPLISRTAYLALCLRPKTKPNKILKLKPNLCWTESEAFGFLDVVAIRVALCDFREGLLSAVVILFFVFVFFTAKNYSPHPPLFGVDFSFRTFQMFGTGPRTKVVCETFRCEKT